MEHRLKIWPEFYEAILEGKKRCEIRREDDRQFNVDDTLNLEPYDPKERVYLQNPPIVVRITHIVREPFLPQGLAVMSFEVIKCMVGQSK